jgi:hypothetical protein
VRLAGALELPDGAWLTWSVADGARGRRWRAVSTVAGSISHGLLLEVDGPGRPTRLELTTPAGMLTLHPSIDQRMIHGNVVGTTGEGVRPHAFRWGPEHELEVVGRPLATAVALARRRSTLAVGGALDVDVLAITANLEVIAGRQRFQRLSESGWRVGPAGSDGAQGPGVELEIDPDGLPTGGVRWALEAD